MSSEVTVNFDYDSEEHGPLYVEVTFVYWMERYGADADGNRGVMMPMSEIEEITIVNSDGKDIYDLIKGKEMDKIEKIADEKAGDAISEMDDSEPEWENNE